MKAANFAVVDLFSGAGGMSYGFHVHPAFRIAAAADAELGKPSAGTGKLQCNSTYFQNIGVSPTRLDLSLVPPGKLRLALSLSEEQHISILSACPPCTGFSRAKPENHLRDDRRNSLVRRSAEFAVALAADVVVMENARELVRGNFKHHYEWFREHLESNGYNVFGRTYMLSRFGLPQVRERAIVVAAKQHLPLHTLDSLWDAMIDGRRISLKSSKAKSLRNKTLHISKLTEAAWIQDCRTAAKRREHTHRLFREYCGDVDAIIQLRYFRDLHLYELVDIPSLFSSRS